MDPETGLVLAEAPGRSVQLQVANGAASQRWQITARGDGYFTIASGATGLRPAVSSRDRNSVIPEPPVTSDSQKWSLQATP
jgi:hypothetical protein